jgi:hypothetical protein
MAFLRDLSELCGKKALKKQSLRGFMTKRYLYSILFGIPGFFVSLILSFLIFGALAGILWLFVFGDDPWSSSTDIILPLIFAVVFFVIWIALIYVGYIYGRKAEADPVQNKTHILISGGITITFIFFIVLQQFSVGNLGPKTNSELCGDFCNQQGYSSSGMPSDDSGNKTCSCFDEEGSEVLKVPLESVAPK